MIKQANKTNNFPVEPELASSESSRHLSIITETIRDIKIDNIIDKNGIENKNETNSDLFSLGIMNKLVKWFWEYKVQCTYCLYYMPTSYGR